jgi:metal-responsive CopG/Arc/MetJ family transcriptional regulator
MQTQKIAITVPKDIIAQLDSISQGRGLSRSRIISDLLRSSLAEERSKKLQDAYNRIFADKKIRDEQIETSRWFEKTESGDGQEW